MIIKKFFIPILAFIGIIFGLFMVIYTSRIAPPVPIPHPPPSPPFSSYIAGAGIVEAESENTSIGTPFNEIVEKVLVKAGDFVKQGEVLFELNVETLNSELALATAQYEEMDVALKEEKARFSFYERLSDKTAVSEEELSTRLYALLEKKASLESAEKAMQVIQTNIDRAKVRAPFNGQVMQVNIREGENAEQNSLQRENLLLFGKVDYYHIRIDIDESDAWRYEKNTPAYAYVRGKSSIAIPLEYVRIEPYVVPKKNLTNGSKERVDTRVLQVIYRFHRGSHPVYLGQLMDVYIQTSKGG